MTAVAEDRKQRSLEKSSVSDKILLQRQLLNRITASPGFIRSERLSAFLLFVCEMSFAGRDSELNEQRIGQEVFGRSKEYDATADGIVRTQASRLRKRLDSFFEEEGQSEPIRLSIPKGGYVPAFYSQKLENSASQAKQIEVGEPIQVIASQAVITREKDRLLVKALPWLVSALCVGLSLIFFISQHRHAVAAQKPAHPLWSVLFQAGRPTLEVPGDSGLVLSYLFDHHAVNLHDYLSGEYRARIDSIANAAPTNEAALKTNLANRRYTSIMDLNVAVTLGELAKERGTRIDVKYARDLRPNDFKNDNVVLIGAQEANPWVELFEKRMNFVLDDDFHGTVHVLNRSPHSNEPREWSSRWEDPEHRVYGIVAFLPNLSGKGSALLVEGTSMAGAESAWDFVSDDVVLLPFIRSIQRTDGSLPHFELVVESQNMSASAVHGNLIAYRRLD